MDWFNWVVMPLIIFCARIIDMTLGTMRIIAVNRGLKKIAPLIGFFEVMTWIVVVRQVIVEMNNPLWFIAYGLGFAAGNYVGIFMSEKMSMTNVLVRIMTQSDSKKLIKNLEKEGYKVTVIKTQYKNHEGSMMFTNVHSSELDETIKIIKKHNPNAVYSVEDVRRVSNELFRTPLSTKKKKFFGNGKQLKKHK